MLLSACTAISDLVPCFLCLSKIYPPEGTSFDFPRHIERVKSTLTSYFTNINSSIIYFNKKHHQTKKIQFVFKYSNWYLVSKRNFNQRGQHCAKNLSRPVKFHLFEVRDLRDQWHTHARYSRLIHVERGL